MAIAQKRGASERMAICGAETKRFRRCDAKHDVQMGVWGFWVREPVTPVQVEAHSCKPPTALLKVDNTMTSFPGELDVHRRMFSIRSIIYPGSLRYEPLSLHLRRQWPP